MTQAARMKTREGTAAYRLDEQVGFLLRKATQRHLAIFAAGMPDLTPQQFAALAKLAEAGPMSQNGLGRITAMDAATVKGVTDRLAARGLVTATPDPEDRRRLVVALTAEGAALFAGLIGTGQAISAETLAPLDAAEQAVFLALLRRIGGD